MEIDFIEGQETTKRMIGEEVPGRETFDGATAEENSVNLLEDEVEKLSALPDTEQEPMNQLSAKNIVLQDGAPVIEKTCSIGISETTEKALSDNNTETQIDKIENNIDCQEQKVTVVEESSCQKDGDIGTTLIGPALPEWKAKEKEDSNISNSQFKAVSCAPDTSIGVFDPIDQIKAPPDVDNIQEKAIIEAHSEMEEDEHEKEPNKPVSSIIENNTKCAENVSRQYQETHDTKDFEVSIKRKAESTQDVTGTEGNNIDTPINKKRSYVKMLKKCQPKENEVTAVIKIDEENYTYFDHSYYRKQKYLFDKFSLIATADKPFSTGENFLKGCKWAPDGTCLLTSSEDSYLRLFDLPHSLYTKGIWGDDEKQLPEVPPSLKVFEGGLICDFAWYPKMSSVDSSSCCFLSTSTGAPIHLWDAMTGQLRASYLAYDYADEVTSALSISFDTSGEKILCGYKNHVRIFDTAVPGRNCTTLNLKALSKQKGLVSCIQENPGLHSVFAVGTYRRTIGLYTTDGCNLCILNGQKGGITQIIFSKDGSKLFSGARKDNEILCWDLRNPGKILYTMKRDVTTNQRIYFDSTPEDTHIMSGGTDGVVRAWKLPNQAPHLAEQCLEQLSQFKAHKDCVNGISINPVYPVLATSSGQRVIAELVSDEEEKEFSMKLPLMRKEFSLKLWWMGPRV